MVLDGHSRTFQDIMGHHGTQTNVGEHIAAISRIPQMAPMLTGSQIRAARALLQLSSTELAARCGISYAAIQRAEKVDGLPSMRTHNLAAIKAALEAAGCVFLDPGDLKPGGYGVRLK